MKNVCTIEIDAPIGKVFDFINDETKHKLWLEGWKIRSASRGMTARTRRLQVHAEDPGGKEGRSVRRRGDGISIVPSIWARGFTTSRFRFKSTTASAT